MRILVIGGSGFLGAHLLSKLLAGEHEITVLTRSKKTAAKLEQIGITGSIGDLLYPMGQLTYRLPPQDVVVSVAAPPFSRDRVTAERFRALQSDVTLHLTSSMDIAEKLDCPLVATQCLRFRTRNGEVADENWPIDHSGISRIWELTDPIIEQALARDFPLVMMLVAPIYGPGGSFQTTVYDRVRDGSYMVVGEGDNYQPLVHVKDCAAAYVNVIERMPLGERFIIADDRACTMRDMADTLSHYMGREEMPPAIGPAKARMAMGRILYESVTTNCVVSNAKAKQYLGWELEYPTYIKGLPATIKEIENFEF